MALNDWREKKDEEMKVGEKSQEISSQLRSKANTRVHLIVDTKSGRIIHSILLLSSLNLPVQLEC